MQKLIKILKKLKEKYPLEEKYYWEIPKSSPVKIPFDLNNYEKNIYLKKYLKALLNKDKDLKIHYWIIQQWGGIKSFKQNIKNNEKILKFKKQLQDEKMTRDIFDRISSLSKIASFIDPEKYIIYDSRVIYSLNWLLFKYSEEKELFPQPIGRNNRINQYDLFTLVKLANKGHIEKSYKFAYFDYCKLMIFLCENVYGNSKPYLLEMLLFSIAPDVIVSMIEKSIEVKIKNNEYI